MQSFDQESGDLTNKLFRLLDTVFRDFKKERYMFGLLLRRKAVNDYNGLPPHSVHSTSMEEDKQLLNKKVRVIRQMKT